MKHRYRIMRLSCCFLQHELTEIIYARAQPRKKEKNPTHKLLCLHLDDSGKERQTSESGCAGPDTIDLWVTFFGRKNGLDARSTFHNKYFLTRRPFLSIERRQPDTGSKVAMPPTFWVLPFLSFDHAVRAVALICVGLFFVERIMCECIVSTGSVAGFSLEE